MTTTTDATHKQQKQQRNEEKNVSTFNIICESKAKINCAHICLGIKFSFDYRDREGKREIIINKQTNKQKKKESPTKIRVIIVLQSMKNVCECVHVCVRTFFDICVWIFAISEVNFHIIWEWNSIECLCVCLTIDSEQEIE